jgi:hypothetical protein
VEEVPPLQVGWEQEPPEGAPWTTAVGCELLQLIHVFLKLVLSSGVKSVHIQTVTHDTYQRDVVVGLKLSVGLPSSSLICVVPLHTCPSLKRSCFLHLL